MLEKSTIIRIGSLNCRSLSSTSNIHKRKQLTTFIRTQKYDILTLQETHASMEQQPILNSLLKSHSGCWSYYCGIVSLNNQIIITPVLFSLDHCFILVQISHLNNFFDPFYTLTIYAPAESVPLRRFFCLSCIIHTDLLSNSVIFFTQRWTQNYMIQMRFVVP